MEAEKIEDPQVSFRLPKEYKKAIDMYCVEKEIEQKEYFRRLVQADTKIKKYLPNEQN